MVFGKKDRAQNYLILTSESERVHATLSFLSQYKNNEKRREL
jgi:hypothetical protein